MKTDIRHQAPHHEGAARSTWGICDVLDDHEAVHLYHDLLRRTSRAGEITAIVLGALMFAGLAWLVLGQNWENYIISDGTDMYCYYDGETDSVSYVDPLADE